MAKLKASGQTAIRARDLRQKARKLEAEARSMTDDTECRNIMERAAQLKDQALSLERASRWFAYLDRKETIGRNNGTQAKTNERVGFIHEVAEGIGSKNREAVAAACLEYRSAKVRTLWRAEGEKARAKILTFMRNHKVP